MSKLAKALFWLVANREIVFQIIAQIKDLTEHWQDEVAAPIGPLSAYNRSSYRDGEATTADEYNTENAVDAPESFRQLESAYPGPIVEVPEDFGGYPDDWFDRVH